MTARLIVADALAGLAGLEPESVQCCVTSPPYWGLRDYGVAGQIGLEATPAEYVARMVEVFEAVRRVLRSDGTLWLNLGDCYATGAGLVGDHPGGGEQGERWKGRGQVVQTKNPRANIPLGPMTQPNRMPQAGLKPKDLAGIPWRVAFALQAAGWWLRSDIVWSKPNPMPESVTDRPTRAHEYLFLLSRSGRYYYDAEAAREPAIGGVSDFVGGWGAGDEPRTAVGFMGANGKAERPENEAKRQELSAAAKARATSDNPTRNARTVWEIATAPYPEAHFATFPPELPRRCILAGSRRGDTVLDPFAGAGTTGLVADQLGRDFIGVELNPAYAVLAERRIREAVPLFAAVEVTGAGPPRGFPQTAMGLGECV